MITDINQFREKVSPYIKALQHGDSLMVRYPYDKYIDAVFLSHETVVVENLQVEAVKVYLPALNRNLVSSYEHLAVTIK